MAWFRVRIRGENFRMLLSDDEACLGFYTTRFVEADTPESAEDAAVAELRSDAKLVGTVRNDPSDPPRMFVERIVEIAQADVPVVAPGFTFFPDDAPAG